MISTCAVRLDMYTPQISHLSTDIYVKLPAGYESAINITSRINSHPVHSRLC
jgi:hypothetical protein